MWRVSNSEVLGWAWESAFLIISHVLLLLLLEERILRSTTLELISPHWKPSSWEVCSICLKKSLLFAWGHDCSVLWGGGEADWLSSFINRFPIICPALSSTSLLHPPKPVSSQSVPLWGSGRDGAYSPPASIWQHSGLRALLFFLLCPVHTHPLAFQHAESYVQILWPLMTLRPGQPPWKPACPELLSSLWILDASLLPQRRLLAGRAVAGACRQLTSHVQTPCFQDRLKGNVFEHCEIVPFSPFRNEDHEMPHSW